MSGFVSIKPTLNSGTYNPSYYNSNAYLKLSDPRVSYISNVLPGQASAKKVLILDSSSNISGINSIGCAGQSIVSGTSQITLNSSSSSTGRSTVAFQSDVGTYELGSRGSANGAYNDSMYIYRGSYLWAMNSSGNTSFLSATDASSPSIGGAMSIAGGCGIAKKLFVGSHATVVGSLLIGSSTDTTRAISALNPGMAINGNQYITFGHSASNNNQAEMSFVYSGAGSSLNRIDFGFYGSNRWFQIQASGDCSFNSPTDATSSSYGGALTSLGGFACQKKLFVGTSASIGTSCTVGSAMNSSTATIGSTSNTGAALSITSVGYHLGCYYNSTNLTLLNTGSSGNFVISPQTGATSTAYTFSPSGQVQLGGIAVRNGHKLDLGTVAQDNLICLHQSSNTSASYMLGVSNASINYCSGGAHTWYSNSSSTPAILGNKEMQLTASGNLMVQGGVHAYSFDNTDMTNTPAGVHMQYSSVGAIFAYDYSASSYKDLAFNNNNIYIKASNGYTGINTSNPSCPLHVNGSAAQSTASGFGYLNGLGAGSASSFTNRQFSILSSGGILVGSGEIDVLSDTRLKQDISQVDSFLADRFVREISPIKYAYSTDSETVHYGYAAQQLVKGGFNALVGYTAADEPLPEEVIECDNGDVLSLPSDTRLVVNLLHTIPLLHTALKRALERIDSIEGNKPKRVKKRVE
jgi:hypothetical protein